MPRQVSLLEAHMNQPSRVALLQARDGYDPERPLEVGADLPPDYTPPLADVAQALAGTPVFALLTREEIDTLARTARPFTVGPAERIIVQGQDGRLAVRRRRRHRGGVPAPGTTATRCISARARTAPCWARCHCSPARRAPRPCGRSTARSSTRWAGASTSRSSRPDPSCVRRSSDAMADATTGRRPSCWSGSARRHGHVGDLLFAAEEHVHDQLHDAGHTSSVPAERRIRHRSAG